MGAVLPARAGPARARRVLLQMTDGQPLLFSPLPVLRGSARAGPGGTCGDGTCGEHGPGRGSPACLGAGACTCAGGVDGVNVTLQLPETWQIHPTFHQSLVKPFYGDLPNDEQPGPVPTADGGNDPKVFEVEEIRGKRTTGRGKKRLVEYFVKWKGYPECDNLWQNAESMGTAADLVAAYESGTRRRRVMR